LMNWE